MFLPDHLTSYIFGNRRLEKNLQFSTSRMAKNGGPVFSAVCGSKLIPISAPEPYKHRGCYRLLFFTNRALFLCPTYTHPIRSFQGMPNSKEIWIAPMRNPIWPLWTKSCMGHCKLVKTVKSECERQKQAPHSILCAHTVLGHWSEYIFTNKRPAGNALEGADGGWGVYMWGKGKVPGW